MEHLLTVHVRLEPRVERGSLAISSVAHKSTALILVVKKLGHPKKKIMNFEKGEVMH